ncbi:GreA/GreB family elongation factor [Euzebya pacifica]|uniref:GreA/GreB family elongation factor n=1 Tax=Euzebya pacifica TaxID=1608957 RepID=UPI0030F61E8A
MSKVMLSTTPVVLTTAGRARLQERLASARRAAAGTDEGSAERQRFLAEITVMEDALRQSVAVEEVQEDPTIVELGDEVVVQDAVGAEETVRIVHPLEARQGADHISVDSPLARALLGRRPGERVLVDAPAGPYELTILDRRRLS